MQMTTWAFGRITAACGVAGALLCGGLSYVAMPDQYVSSTTLHLNVLEEPSTDFTGRLVVGLLENTLGRDSLAGVIERQVSTSPRGRPKEWMAQSTGCDMTSGLIL